jgi:hypothetical protein
VEYGVKLYDGSTVNSIGIYFITRQYGGPEEGGWYYDHYELKHSFFVGNMPREKVSEFLKSLFEWEESMNEGAPSLGSTQSRGLYSVMFEEEPGEFETRETPRYE